MQKDQEGSFGVVRFKRMVIELYISAYNHPHNKNPLSYNEAKSAISSRTPAPAKAVKRGSPNKDASSEEPFGSDRTYDQKKAIRDIPAYEMTKQYPVDLAIKTFKEKDTEKKTLSAKNCFKNELIFINHVKDKCCQFLPQYYQEKDAKIDELTTIHMDIVPWTLENVIRKNPSLSSKTKLKLIQQLALALYWLSEQRICHRDIKPQNILVTRNMEIRLVDFGSCCSAVSLEGTKYM